ncbi:hypothetical protein B0H14DRAFT_2611230 [Mycena olivaceomarginata]|nr:hypothetical protein B0H14DRAFT_2611230 [Mycena olivaceomarginata]
MPLQGQRERQALLETQKMLGVVLKQNRMLTAASAQAEASRPGWRTKQDTSAWPKGPNIKDYHALIIKIGKSFTVIQFPWVDPSAFTAKISFPVASPRDIWKPNPISVLFPQQLTAMIYQHVPEHFHGLVNTADLPEFAANFCHHTSAKRSSALKTLKVELPKILLAQKLITDVTDPAAWRGLVVWPEDADKKISPYPPLIYHKNTKSLAGFMKKAAMPLCARIILFGPASLEDKGSRRPQNQTLGQLWHVVEPNTAFISFVCTTAVFICYWSSLEDQKPESFTPVGATSKIDFREIYMCFRWALESKAEDASTSSIIRFWHQCVFKGITGVPALPTTDRASERINKEAELEAAMGGLDVEEDSLVYSDEEDFDSAINTLASAAIVRARGPDPAPTGRGQPAIAATAAIDSQLVPHPRVVLGPSIASDDNLEVDESLESPVCPSNRRSQARVIVNSEDDAPSQPEEDGHRAEDLHVQLEAKLKSLKVVDLALNELGYETDRESKLGMESTHPRKSRSINSTR